MKLKERHKRGESKARKGEEKYKRRLTRDRKYKHD